MKSEEKTPHQRPAKWHLFCMSPLLPFLYIPKVAPLVKLDGWSKFEEWVEGYAQTWHPATPPPAHLQSPTHNYQMVFGDGEGGKD